MDFSCTAYFAGKKGVQMGEKKLLQNCEDDSKLGYYRTGFCLTDIMMNLYPGAKPLNNLIVNKKV
jgi:hypothetical protein